MATGPATQSFKQFETEGWQRQTPNYDDLAGRMTMEAVAPLLEAVNARPEMRLLDVCCGPGYLTAEAAERGLSAVGIDITPAMVDLARARVPGPEFRVGDAEGLDFADGSFDAVACAFGLLHLAEPERAIAEAFRVLRPGGAYAFTVWDGPERGEFFNTLMQAVLAHADKSVSLPPGPSLFQLADRASTSAALEHAGFRSVAIREVPITFHGAQPEDVWDFLEKSTIRAASVVRQQTPEVRARVKAGLLGAAGRYAGPGGVSIPSPALLFAARKPTETRA